MTTQTKLAFFKAKADKAAKQNPHASEDYKTWQFHAKQSFHFSGHSSKNPRFGMTDKGQIRFHCGIEEIPGYRTDKMAHDVVSLRHTGWYGDDIEHETLCGFVAVFRMGKTVFVVPGVQYSESDCHYLDFSKADKLYPDECWDENGYETDILESCIRDNAHYSDDMARRDAEENREADQKFRAEELSEEIKSSIVSTRTQIKALINEIKNAGRTFSPGICTTLGDKIKSLRSHIQQCRKAIEALNDAPYDYSKFYSLV